MFPCLFSARSEVNVKQCVLFVSGRPIGYLLLINTIRDKTCTFRISYITRTDFATFRYPFFLYAPRKTITCGIISCGICYVGASG